MCEEKPGGDGWTESVELGQKRIWCGRKPKRYYRIIVQLSIFSLYKLKSNRKGSWFSPSHSCNRAFWYCLPCCWSLIPGERIGLKGHQLGGVEEMGPNVAQVVWQCGPDWTFPWGRARGPQGLGTTHLIVLRSWERPVKLEFQFGEYSLSVSLICVRPHYTPIPFLASLICSPNSVSKRNLLNQGNIFITLKHFF